MATNTRWQDIYNNPINKAVVGSNPNLIYPGQVLTMPDGSLYTVVAGDNLTKIAANYNSQNQEAEDPAPPPPAEEPLVNDPPSIQNLSSQLNDAISGTGENVSSSGDFGKYNIGSHMYPNDLMAPDGRYGGNYVIFYINVATDSKLFKDKSVETVDDIPPRDRGDLIAQGLTKDQLTGANAVTNTLAGIVGGSIATGSAAGAAKGAAVANIPTVGVGFTGTMAPDATRSQKRLKTAIALHVPNQLQIRYGMQWSDEDTAALAMAGAAVQQGVEITKALQSKNNNSDVKGVGKAIIANLTLSKGPNAGANSAALGLAANPKKEQVFKGVDFRTFQFDYQFFPRDSAEAQNVLNIIHEFKYHMHPEFKDTNNFVYIYPSEFDVYYYQGGRENTNLHRHTSCVLTEMNVNYTPNGAFTTFANGMPTQINVTMSFRELALLTKDKVKDGL